ncbi:MAG TPA: hypothetical protein VG841_15040 [Caulobacterales bacterium]|nr:hypothetical protein [Caulobacterales bacterium]
MRHKITAVIAALSLALTALAPSAASARDRHHGYGGYRHDHHHHGDDAVAAGVVGLALGVALGAALSSDNDRRDRCYDRCGPPPPPPQGYYGRGAYEGDADFGPPPPGYADDGSDVCIRQVQQWDPYAGRYVWVNLRTHC